MYESKLISAHSNDEEWKNKLISPFQLYLIGLSQAHILLARDVHKTWDKIRQSRILSEEYLGQMECGQRNDIDGQVLLGILQQLYLRVYPGQSEDGQCWQ